MNICQRILALLRPKADVYQQTQIAESQARAAERARASENRLRERAAENKIQGDYLGQWIRQMQTRSNAGGLNNGSK